MVGGGRWRCGPVECSIVASGKRSFLFSEADRAIYIPHPDHKAFGGVLGPHLDDVLVIDYRAK